jgi:hypothetical protein
VTTTSCGGIIFNITWGTSMRGHTVWLKTLNLALGKHFVFLFLFLLLFVYFYLPFCLKIKKEKEKRDHFQFFTK